MTISSRRQPWPYDAKIANVGVMLKPDPQTGLLVGKKVQDLNTVAPTDYSYASQPPFIERTYALRRLTGGMGLRLQTGANEARYRYTLFVDCSIGGMPMKGPEFTSITPATTGQIRGFVEALDGGTLTLFALAGQYVLKRGGDAAINWTVSKDFGASNKYATSGARFKDAGVSPVDGLYVANAQAELWQYNGATWAQATGVSAQWLETLSTSSGIRLWAGNGSNVINVAADPLTAANWSGAIAVGNPARNLTWLRSLYGELYAFKEDGIFTFNGDGSTNDLFPSLRVTPSTSNGLNAVAWLNYLWFSFGDSFYKVGKSAYGFSTIDPVGAEHLVENDSEVTGTVTCFAGHEAWFGYMGLYNSQTGDSYLLKYGGWVPGQDTSRAQFSEVIHGALYKWTAKKITAMKISSIPGPNDRLYCGFDDGSIEWCTLPRGTPNPKGDSACRFTTQAGYLFWPLHNGNFPADVKHFRGASVFGPHIDANNYCRIAYRVDDDAAYRDLTNPFTRNGERVDLPINTVGYVIDVRSELVNGSDTDSPWVEGFGLHEALRPALKLQYSMIVRAGNRLAKRDGSIDRKTAQQVKDVVFAAAEAGGSVEFLLPDESSQALTIEDYAEILAPDQARYGFAWDLPISGVQYRLNSVYGTIGRLTPFTIGDLSAWTIAQLGEIVTTSIQYGTIARLKPFTVGQIVGYSIGAIGAL